MSADPDFSTLEVYFYPDAPSPETFAAARIAWRRYRHRSSTATRIARASSPAIATAAAELEQAGAAARKAGEHASRATAALTAVTVAPDCAACDGTGEGIEPGDLCLACRGRGR